MLGIWCSCNCGNIKRYRKCVTIDLTLRCNLISNEYNSQVHVASHHMRVDEEPVAQEMQFLRTTIDKLSSIQQEQRRELHGELHQLLYIRNEKDFKEIQNVFSRVLGPSLADSILEGQDSTRVYDKIKPLLSLIIDLDNTITEEEWEDALSTIASFLEDKTINQVIAVLEVIIKIPNKKRANVLKSTIPLLKGLDDREKREISKIFYAVMKISSTNQEEVIKVAISLIQALSEAPVEDACKAITWCPGIGNLLLTISRIPPNEQQEMGKLTSSLIPFLNSNYRTAYGISKILYVLKLIAREDREDAVKTAISFLNLLEKRITYSEMWTLLWEIGQIPKEKQKDSIQKFLSLRKRKRKMKNILTILCKTEGRISRLIDSHVEFDIA